jgi:hypothetical protein
VFKTGFYTCPVKNNFANILSVNDFIAGRSDPFQGFCLSILVIISFDKTCL